MKTTACKINGPVRAQKVSLPMTIANVSDTGSGFFFGNIEPLAQAGSN